MRNRLLGIEVSIAACLRLPSSEKVEIDREQNSQGKGAHCYCINEPVAKVTTGKPFGVISNERSRQISFSQLLLDTPLPVGDGAIADPVPNAQHEPGTEGEGCHQKMRFPHAGPYPRKKVEADDG